MVQISLTKFQILQLAHIISNREERHLGEANTLELIKVLTKFKKAMRRKDDRAYVDRKLMDYISLNKLEAVLPTKRGRPKK